MIKFIKKLLFGTPTAPAKVEAPYKVEPVSTAADFVVASATSNVPNVTASAPTATYIPPAKPANRKVRAVTEPVKEGNTKGGNGIVKKQTPTAKPPAPPAPSATKPAGKSRKPYRGKPKAKK